MLNKTFFNILLTFESLVPAFIVYAFTRWDSRGIFWGLFVGSIILTGVSLWVLYQIPKKIAPRLVEIEETKNIDKEPLGFLLAYLWPFMTQPIEFTENIWVFIAVIFVFVVCFYQSSAFIFNPVLTLLGYHFYEIKVGKRVKTFLISKKIFSLEKNTLRICELSNNVWFDLGGENGDV